MKALDSYEEKEDEAIKEVGRKASEKELSPGSGATLSILSPTDGSSDPGSRTESAGSGPICLRGWFPSADPEQYPNPLMPGFPWSTLLRELMAHKSICLDSLLCGDRAPQWRCGQGWELVKWAVSSIIFWGLECGVMAQGGC